MSSSSKHSDDGTPSSQQEETPPKVNKKALKKKRARERKAKEKAARDKKEYDRKFFEVSPEYRTNVELAFRTGGGYFRGFVQQGPHNFSFYGDGILLPDTKQAFNYMQNWEAQKELVKHIERLIVMKQNIPLWYKDWKSQNTKLVESFYNETPDERTREERFAPEQNAPVAIASPQEQYEMNRAFVDGGGLDNGYILVNGNHKFSLFGDGILLPETEAGYRSLNKGGREGARDYMNQLLLHKLNIPKWYKNKVKATPNVSVASSRTPNTSGRVQISETDPTQTVSTEQFNEGLKRLMVRFFGSAEDFFFTDYATRALPMPISLQEFVDMIPDHRMEVCQELARRATYEGPMPEWFVTNFIFVPIMQETNLEIRNQRILEYWSLSIGIFENLDESLQEPECLGCFKSFQPRTKIGVRPNCQHYSCVECTADWIIKVMKLGGEHPHITCPVCRAIAPKNPNVFTSYPKSATTTSSEKQ
ncbi:MAG: hypothetical protein ACTSUE_26335 [Promethearchaeota archaeon]